MRSKNTCTLSCMFPEPSSCLRLLQVVTIFSILFLKSNLACSESCNNLLNQQLYTISRNVDIFQTHEDVDGVIVPVAIVSARKHKLKAYDLFGDRENLVLGFNSSGHAYIVARTIRFDGNLFYQAGTINHNSDLLDEGILFKIPASPEQIDSVIESFSKGSPRGATCVSAACKVLRVSAELELNQSNDLLLTSVVNELLMQGRDPDSRSGLGIKSYLINASLKPLMQGFKQNQIFWGAVSGFASSLSLTPLFLILNMLH